MKDTFYLVFDKSKVARISKSYPSLKAGERTFKFNFSVPDTIFKTPEYTANLQINQKDIDDKINQFEIEFNRIKSNE